MVKVIHKKLYQIMESSFLELSQCILPFVHQMMYQKRPGVKSLMNIQFFLGKVLEYRKWVQQTTMSWQNWTINHQEQFELDI